MTNRPDYKKDANGFSLEEKTLVHYDYDPKTGRYLGPSSHTLQMHTKPPARLVYEKPPECPEGFVVVRTENGWEIQEDTYGKQIFHKETGASEHCYEYGGIPATHVLEEPPAGLGQKPGETGIYYDEKLEKWVAKYTDPVEHAADLFRSLVDLLAILLLTLDPEDFEKEMQIIRPYARQLRSFVAPILPGFKQKLNLSVKGGVSPAVLPEPPKRVLQLMKMTNLDFAHGDGSEVGNRREHFISG